MKKFQKPPSKETAIALGFTLGIHVVALTGLLFLGLSKVPEPPKQIKTVLVKPEDLPPPELKPLIESESTETADTKVAEKVQQTAEPVADAPNIPTEKLPEETKAPDTKALDQQKRNPVLLPATDDELKMLNNLRTTPTQNFFAAQHERFSRFVQSIFQPHSS